jgi:hypothetical protein
MDGSHQTLQSVTPSSRRDALRFLKALDSEKFADGIRQALTDDEISMCFWLTTGLPPQLRLRDLRARHRGEL